MRYLFLNRSFFMIFHIIIARTDVACNVCTAAIGTAAIGANGCYNISRGKPQEMILLMQI